MSDPVTLALLFLLLSKGKGGGGTSSGGVKAHGAMSPNELVNRATQARAAAWVPYFQDVGETPAVADALSRWAGLESGGDSTIISVLNERGLLQVGPQTMSEGGITQQDWDEYTGRDTLPNEVARISSGYATWLFNRAITHMPTSVPALMSPTDKVWYAYLYHQRPKDFTQWGEIPGNAAQASGYLLGRAHLNNDDNLAKRVTACNVVAFGTPDSPTAPMA